MGVVRVTKQIIDSEVGSIAKEVSIPGVRGGGRSVSSCRRGLSAYKETYGSKELLTLDAVYFRTYVNKFEK